MGNCKKGKMGVFFVKKVDLSSTQGALCTVSVFLFYILLIWGVRRPTGLLVPVRSAVKSNLTVWCCENLSETYRLIYAELNRMELSM